MLKEASKTAQNVIHKTIQKTTLKMNVNEINTIISLSFVGEKLEQRTERAYGNYLNRLFKV